VAQQGRTQPSEQIDEDSFLVAKQGMTQPGEQSDKDTASWWQSKVVHSHTNKVMETQLLGGKARQHTVMQKGDRDTDS
jgi:hypothetical protein